MKNMKKTQLFLVLVLLIYFLTDWNAKSMAQSNITYSEVKIGEQIWMVQNLNVSTFRNGDPIKQITDPKDWVRAFKKREPAWCYYLFNSELGPIIGKLYNYHAVRDPRGLAPEGWRIPNYIDFSLLRDYLGNHVTVVEKKLKATGGWAENGNGNNLTGFSALPGGAINNKGEFINLGYEGYWWIFKHGDKTNGDTFRLVYDAIKVSHNSMFPDYVHGNGFSVRCIKEDE